MGSPALTFLGATGSVTGSKFLVDADRSRVLVDAGLYQGLRELRRRNWEPFAVPPADLDAVLVTHAHLDHCGYLPRLVREGFSGPVYCTQESAELIEIVLRDSAHLQEEDARLADTGGWSKHRPALPLYDGADVEATLPLLCPVDFDRDVEVGPGLRASWRPAGHILGSATVLVETGKRRTLFSGDLGRPGHPVLVDPVPPPSAHSVVVESTYGDRAHPVADPDALAGAIRRTAGRGGSVLIPAFAVTAPSSSCWPCTAWSGTAGSLGCRSTSTAPWRWPRSASTVARSLRPHPSSVPTWRRSGLRWTTWRSAVSPTRRGR